MRNRTENNINMRLVNLFSTSFCFFNFSHIVSKPNSFDCACDREYLLCSFMSILRNSRCEFFDQTLSVAWYAFVNFVVRIAIKLLSLTRYAVSFVRISNHETFTYPWSSNICWNSKHLISSFRLRSCSIMSLFGFRSDGTPISFGFLKSSLSFGLTMLAKFLWT